MNIKLYNSKPCAPCSFVRVVGKEIGIEFELIDIELFKGDHLTPEFQKINPFRMVPVLNDNGFVIYESSAISSYLINKYAPNSKLYPRDPEARGKIDQILFTVQTCIAPHIMSFFKSCFNAKKKPPDEKVKTHAAEVFTYFENVIGSGLYALGDTISLADLSIFAHINMYIPIPAFNIAKHPKLVSYQQRIADGLPHSKEIYEPFLQIRKKKWEALA